MGVKVQDAGRRNPSPRYFVILAQAAVRPALQSGESINEYSPSSSTPPRIRSTPNGGFPFPYQVRDKFHGNDTIKQKNIFPQKTKM